jgi:hypothetical protein
LRKRSSKNPLLACCGSRTGTPTRRFRFDWSATLPPPSGCQGSKPSAHCVEQDVIYRRDPIESKHILRRLDLHRAECCELQYPTVRC